MKRQLKPFVVERKRRLPATGQPASIWSDVMTAELRILVRKIDEPAAPTDNDAGTEARHPQALSSVQPEHRAGRILISRVDPAPAQAEPVVPTVTQKPKPYRRRSSDRQSPDIRSPDVTAIPPETADVLTEAVDVRTDAVSIELPVPSSEAIARAPYRVRRREATRGMKLEHRWKRGLILPD